MSMSPHSSEEQTAGLSTAESGKPRRVTQVQGKMNPPSKLDPSYAQNGSVEIPNSGLIYDAPSPPSPPSPAPASPKRTSKRGVFSSTKARRDTSNTNTNNDGNNISLSQSIGGSAPTILIHTPSSSSHDDPIRRPLRSAMSSRTIHESLHRGGIRPKLLNRSVSFANVNIREYERVLGDNPSVTSGPPLSIGWRYVPEPTSVSIDDYEDGKGESRSSSEYLVPKSVREKILREQADVSRREMVQVIRETQKQKAQRRKTVVNLNMQKTEEKIEGAKRKIKKILKSSKSYDAVEAQLWDEAHLIAMEKAKRLEESIRKGESISSRDLYRVGTPCNNILPSRRNTFNAGQGGMGNNMHHEGPDRHTIGDPGDVRAACTEVAASESSSSHQYQSKKSIVQRKSSGGLSLDDESHHKPGGTTAVRRGSTHSHRSSGNIVATEESESDEIFAKLMLDDSSASTGHTFPGLEQLAQKEIERGGNWTPP